MSVDPGDRLKTVVEHQLGDGTIVQNVFHHRTVAVASFADAVVVAAIKTWVDGAYNYLESMTKSTVIAQLSTVDKVAWDGTKWAVTANVGTFTPSFVPTLVDDQEPNQVSPFVVFETSRPKTKGKKFLFGQTELTMVGSILVPALITALVSYAGDILVDVPLNLPLEYLVSGVPRKAVNEFFDFTAAVVTNVVGTQRRRRPGVGV